METFQICIVLFSPLSLSTSAIKLPVKFSVTVSNNQQLFISKHISELHHKLMIIILPITGCCFSILYRDSIRVYSAIAPLDASRQVYIAAKSVKSCAFKSANKNVLRFSEKYISTLKQTTIHFAVFAERIHK